MGASINTEARRPMQRLRALGATLATSTPFHIGVIVALGLTLRLAFLTRVPVFLLRDSGGYHLPAWDLANGLGFDLTPRRTPGYPLFLAGVIEFAGEDLFAIALVQHLLGIGVALITYAIARRLFNPTIGLIAGIVVVLEGTLLVAEHYVMPETLFTVFVLTSTWLILATRGHHWSWAIIALGMCIGATALIRPVGLVLIPIAALSLVCTPWTWRQRLTGVATLAVGAGLVILPWIVRNAQVHGQASMSTTLPKSLLARTAKHDRGFTYFSPARADQYGDRRETQARQIIQSAINQRLSDGEIYDRLGERLRLTDPEVDKLLRDLTTRVIMERPIYFVQRSAEFTWELLVGDAERLRADWKTQNARLSRDEWEDRVEHLLTKASPQQEADFPISEALVDLVQPSRLGAALPLIGLLGWLLATRRLGMSGFIPGLIALALIATPATADGPVPRYRYPVDPIISLLAIGSLTAIPALMALARRQRVPTAPRPLPVAEGH